MRDIIEVQQRKLESHATRESLSITVAEFLQQVNKLLSQFLQPCPPAALAFSGVCLIANVGGRLALLRPFH